MKILFVCMGNICRSPTAEAVMQRRLAESDIAHRVIIDSAATHGYHLGAAPDQRSQEYASKRGYDLSSLRARAVQATDFTEYDWLLVMDHENRRDLQAECPPSELQKIKLLLDFANNADTDEVPDPYYGGQQGFERVLDLIEESIEGLIHYLKTN
ncbi:MAG: low molecular weight phosphotyrosine protein phosphatase [Gammaproteobacteria bacterium]|nr:low molecular weight phosphotyrosine protein phosphatase [Gammaproteobacteria bacterium]